MVKISSKQRNEKDYQKLKDMPYKEYLQTNHYLRLARNVKKRDNNTCQICGISKLDNELISLNAHHNSYENKGNYDKEFNDMITLCSACHIIEHEFTSIDGYSECYSCKKEYRLLNLIPVDKQILKECDFKEGEYRKSCITYECPYCKKKTWCSIDVYNIQKMFDINRVRTIFEKILNASLYNRVEE